MKNKGIDIYRDAVAGTVMAAVSGAYLWGTGSIRHYGDAAVDSRFFPYILGSLMLVLSVALLMLGLRNACKGVQPSGEYTRCNYKVPLCLLVIIGYILLIGQIGFVLASTLFLIAQTFLMAPRQHWRPVLTVVVSFVFSWAVNAVFIHAFDLYLPEGIL